MAEQQNETSLKPEFDQKAGKTPTAFELVEQFRKEDPDSTYAVKNGKVWMANKHGFGYI